MKVQCIEKNEHIKTHEQKERKDKHVSNNKLEREGSYLQKEYVYIMFHIYAHLDIRV
jgi:hypothetical protein